MREGWQVYLHNLRLYLTHFAGQRCSWIMVLGNAPEPQDRAWAKFAGALGLGDPAEGERAAATAPGVPALAGVTEWVGRGEPHHGLMLRVDDPAPGLALVFVYEYRGLINTSLHAYLFGDEAPLSPPETSRCGERG